MRVLHVAESVRGGCGTYLNEVVPPQISELGPNHVRVIVPRQHLAQLPAVARQTLLPFDRQSRLAGLMRLHLTILVAIWRFRPDIVHAHSSLAGLAVRVIGLLLWRRPVILYCPHGWAFEVSTSRPVREAIARCERILSRCCDRIIAISEAERLQAEQAGISRARLIVLHNAISSQTPSTQAADWPPGRRRILFVGRLDRQKGLDILLAAIAGLSDRLSLRIVGESVVAQSAMAAPPAPGVDYLGWLSLIDVTRQMNACDLLVIPSRWEGFGLVAIEAMRAGKPVLAARVGGLPEIIVDGITGRLFPPQDVAALRAALLQDTDETLARMGRAGQDLFQRRFTSDRLNAALMELYRHHLATGRRAFPGRLSRQADTAGQRSGV